MFIPFDVLVLVALGVAMLLLALFSQYRAVKKRLDARPKPQARLHVDLSIPEPPEHVHQWPDPHTEPPNRTKGYWKEYDCKVQGCRADPMTMAGV